MTSTELKIAAAVKALDYVKHGMNLGIGTGTTADEFTRLLGAKVKDGFEIQAVPTSQNTEKLCQKLAIKTYTLDQITKLDLTIDGTDELDYELRLIKGGGGALLREKIVAKASKEMIVIADHSKLVKTLGAFALPIEVVPFGLASTEIAIKELALNHQLNGEFTLRKNSDGSTFITDGGHFIIDALFGRISDAKRLCNDLNKIPGVVENGLFINIASKALVASQDGVKIINRS